MKINDIILESDEQSSQQQLKDILSKEFDDEFGAPKLPQFMMLDKASSVALAVGLAKRPLWTPGMALKYAIKQLYPNFNSAGVFHGAKFDKTRAKVAADVATEIDINPPGVKLSANPKKDNTTRDTSAGTGGWDDSTHGHLRTTGGTLDNVLKAVNPLAGLNTTDWGTTVSSAMSKVKQNSKHLSKMGIKKS